jgi:hypothetical protein
MFVGLASWGQSIKECDAQNLKFGIISCVVLLALECYKNFNVRN